MGTKGLRNAAIFTFFVSMGILLIGGHFAKDRIPSIPRKVVRGEAALTDRACGRSLKQHVALANRILACRGQCCWMRDTDGHRANRKTSIAWRLSMQSST